MKHGWTGMLLQLSAFLFFIHSKCEVNWENKLPCVFAFMVAEKNVLFNTINATFLWLKTYTYTNMCICIVWNIHITYTVIMSQLIGGNL